MITMAESFCEEPILNSPDEEPTLHHAFDAEGLPLDRPLDSGRRRSERISPVPMAKKRRGQFADAQARLDLNGDGLVSVEYADIMGIPFDLTAWFIDTDYNEGSFIVRHAYFLGANDPYKALKTSLKAEIDREAWETLYRDPSRPFSRPASGRFAMKVINYFGDEVMTVFGV